ncbi:DMT family transporter [Halegenticoccus tardaugens]|uniref:DMT family transporter n=1 Tax=Halegenticoccus tardaugens TaxID=2071624 RepID=UPI00100BB8A1|nr:EamA family transporter [Halegenticoccus tardaugens]
MRRYRDAAIFLALSAIWGTAFMVTKAGLDHLPPALFAALRFDLAAALLFGYVAATGARWRPRTADDAAYVLAGGALAIGGHHAFLFAGQQHVSSAVAAVLLGLVPVITPALTRLFSTGERLSPLGVAGVALGFVGVVVIADPDPTNLLSSDVRGVALVLAAAVAFAVGAVATYSREPSLPLVSTQAWMMAIGALLLHATSLALPTEPLSDVTWAIDAVAAVAYLGVVAGALGFLTYFHLLERVGPIEMSFIEYVIPIFAALAGWLALGETVESTTVVGFLVILVGFALIKRRALAAELARFRRDATSVESGGD